MEVVVQQDVMGKTVECPICHHVHLLYILNYKNEPKKLGSRKK